MSIFQHKPNAVNFNSDDDSDDGKPMISSLINSTTKSSNKKRKRKGSSNVQTSAKKTPKLGVTPKKIIGDDDDVVLISSSDEDQPTSAVKKPSYSDDVKRELQKIRNFSAASSGTRSSSSSSKLEDNTIISTTAAADDLIQKEALALQQQIAQQRRKIADAKEKSRQDAIMDSMRQAQVSAVKVSSSSYHFQMPRVLSAHERAAQLESRNTLQNLIALAATTAANSKTQRATANRISSSSGGSSSSEVIDLALSDDDGNSNSSSNAAVSSNHIIIRTRLIGKQGDQLHEKEWPILPMETFAKMKKMFAAWYGLNQAQFSFQLDGCSVSDRDTPDQLEMESGNVVDVKVGSEIYNRAVQTAQRKTAAATASATTTASAAAAVVPMVKLRTRLVGSASAHEAHEWKWKISKAEHMGNMRKKFSFVYGLALTEFKFIFDGSEVLDDDTPEDLDMDDDDMIDVKFAGAKVTTQLYQRAVQTADATKRTI